MRISHGHEENTNGAYASRSRLGYKLDIDDTARADRYFDTPDKRDNTHGFYSSSDSERHHHHHWQHPYKRSDKKYFREEFKKAKPPNFDGDVNNLEDEKSRLLGMKKFFVLHNYSKNIKSKITIFSLKGK